MAQPSAVRRTGLTTRAFAFPDISAVPNPVSALTTTGTRAIAVAEPSTIGLIATWWTR